MVDSRKPSRPHYIRAARQAGVTEEEIGELVANLALNILTNYFNIMAHVGNDWPLVSL
jgi:alkylhydroperoxidase/carboxymuconolactone decarboxylase family protein YurZ